MSWQLRINLRGLWNSLPWAVSVWDRNICQCDRWCHTTILEKGAQWLSGRVLDSRPKGREFEPHRRHCVVSLSKNINPSLGLVQPRKTRSFITERLLMGRKESNQTNKQFLKMIFLRTPHSNERLLCYWIFLSFSLLWNCLSYPHWVGRNPEHYF